MYTERRKDRITREMIEEIMGGKIVEREINGCPIDVIVVGTVRPDLIPKHFGERVDKVYMDTTKESHYLISERETFRSILTAQPLEEGLASRLIGQYQENDLRQMTKDLAGVLRRVAHKHIEEVGKVYGVSVADTDYKLVERSKNIEDAIELVSDLAKRVIDVDVMRQVQRYRDSFDRQGKYFQRKLQ